MAEKSDHGFLVKAFTGAAKLATIGLIAAVGWQIFLDPIFFPIFHDPTNMTAQAFVSFIHSNFSWIPDLIGLTGDGGLLHTEFAQNVLAPHYELLAPPTPEELMETFEGGLSLDSLG